MNPTAILFDEDAVSPVIGVALLLAITVVLAGVVGAFLLSTEVQQTPPDTDWTVSENTDGSAIDAVEFLHDGGETINGEQLRVVYTGSVDISDDIDDDTIYSAGDIFVVEFDDDDSDAAGEELRVIWSAPDSDQTEIIHSHTVTDDVTDS